MLNRYFFSGRKKCTNGCIYCFSHWDTPPFFNPFDQFLSNAGHSIIYPICDSEINNHHKSYLDELLIQCSDIKNSVISIATKSKWSREALEKISIFNRTNSSTKLKLSVSFSCKHGIPTMEPNAMSYIDRLKLLHDISDMRIPTTVMLKPMLPFISVAEYLSIVRDCIPYCIDFVTGGLYINKNSSFYINHIKGKYNIECKYCEWMQCNTWYIEYPKIDHVKAEIRKLGGVCYSSDMDYIEKRIITGIWKQGKY